MFDGLLGAGVGRKIPQASGAFGDLGRLLGRFSEDMPRIPKPGYEKQAYDYEQAFRRGDLNSPAIIGQDPANFGYPADVAPQKPPVQQGFGATLGNGMIRNIPSLPSFEELLRRR